MAQVQLISKEIDILSSRTIRIYSDYISKKNL